MQLWEQIREWYNGYLFAPGGSRVYNPFSLLSCLANQTIGNYWAESGTPDFLVDLLAQQRYNITHLAQLESHRIAQSTYNVAHPDIAALLYQTGYLTLSSTPATTLMYPNREVATTFAEILLEVYWGQPPHQMPLIYQMRSALQVRDLERFFTLLNSSLAQTPYNLIKEAEWFYQSLLHQLFTVMGLLTDSE